MDIDKTKANLQIDGYMVRMTEWFEGYQCCAFARTNPHKYSAVSPWMKTEAEGWAWVEAEVEKIEKRRYEEERTQAVPKETLRQMAKGE